MQKVMVDMGEIFSVRNAICSNTVVETMQLVFGHLDNLCVTCNMLWASHTSLASVFNMHHAVTLLSGRARSCQQSNAYFKGISLSLILTYRSVHEIHNYIHYHL